MLIQIEIDVSTKGRGYDTRTGLTVGALSSVEGRAPMPPEVDRLLDGAGAKAYEVMASYSVDIALPAGLQDGDLVALRYDAELLGAPDLALFSDGVRVVAAATEDGVVPIYLTLSAADAGTTQTWGIIALKERDDAPCRLRSAAAAASFGTGRATFFTSAAPSGVLSGLSEGLTDLTWRARCRMSVPLTFKERLRTFTPDNAEDEDPPSSAILTPSSSAWSSLLTPAGSTSPRPTLLLIHGTGLQSTLGFAGLRERLPADEPKTLLRRLYDHYGGRVIALDHKTISRPVEENLQLLADSLPSGDGVLCVDILAVSRGGLVARGLVEGLAKTVFTPSGEALSDRVRVRRVALVATPNNGTPMGTSAGALACLDRVRCEREDGKSGVGFTPDLTLLGSWGQEVFEHLFPGAAQMRPGSALLQRLNGFSGTSTAIQTFGGVATPVYHAVAARFKATALSYRGCVDGVFDDTANDLIVPTRPCITPTVKAGGLAASLFTLSGGRKHTFEEDAEVTHVDYFFRARTHRLIKAWLMDGVELTLPT